MTSLGKRGERESKISDKKRHRGELVHANSGIANQKKIMNELFFPHAFGQRSSS